jgi:preprotein translocase subunit SecF
MFIFFISTFIFSTLFMRSLSSGFEIIQTFGILVTAIGTLSSLFIAWRLDQRQTREAILKEKEYELKIAELEHKLATLTPAAGAGEKTDPP